MAVPAGLLGVLGQKFIQSKKSRRANYSTATRREIRLRSRVRRYKTARQIADRLSWQPLRGPSGSFLYRSIPCRPRRAAVQPVPIRIESECHIG